MHFRLKIFSATLAILLFTLVLNSVLSISSFERIYSRSLISIMESAGISLKQDIERGVLLGKPLDAFEGMDRMLSDFLESNPKVDNVAVSIDAGEIKYFQGNERNGLELLFRYASKHYGQKESRDSFEQSQYLLYIPVFHRAEEEPRGAVLLSFSQTVIIERITEMAYGALSRLGWSLGLTALVLVVLLGLFVVRPIRNDLEKIRQALLPFIQDSAGTASSGTKAGHEKRQYHSGYISVDSPASAGEHASAKPGYHALVQKFPDSRKIRNDIVSLGAYLQEIALEIQSEKKQPVGHFELDAEEIEKGLKECNRELEQYIDKEKTSLEFESKLKALMSDNQKAIEALNRLKSPSSDRTGQSGTRAPSGGSLDRDGGS